MTASATKPPSAPAQILQEKLAAARVAQKSEEGLQAATPAASEDIIYQQYKSAKPSTRIVTDKGIRVAFVGFELLTVDEHVIEYLDTQIAKHGLPGITKGEALTLDDRDPMATMRRSLKEELRLEIEAELLAKHRGETRDLGETESKGMKVAGTDKLAAAAASNGA